MKPTLNTLSLMRHSAGAVIAASLASGSVNAMESNTPAVPSLVAESLPIADSLPSSLAETEKQGEKKEEKKEEEKDACPACGMG